MSATVACIGRQRRPVCRAALTSQLWRPASGPVGGTQIGSSVHGSIPEASISSGVNHTNSAEDPVTALADSSNSPIVAWPTGLTALKIPPTRSSAQRSIQGEVSGIDVLQWPFSGARCDYFAALA